MFLFSRSKLFVLPILLCLFSVSYGQTQTSDAALTAPVRIFALNLWNAAVDLKLGNEGIFSTTNLTPGSASQLVIVEKAVPRSVFYRAANTQAWQESKKADGSVLSYDIKSGASYMILVQENGVPGLYELKAEANDKAKIAVFNATGRGLSLLRIGSGVDEGVEIQGDGLGAGWTDFGDIVAGAHKVFWAYTSMPAGTAYFYIPARDGLTVGKTSFSQGGWYVLVLRHDTEKNTDSGVIWDISPSR